jgi:hypothetical protein
MSHTKPPISERMTPAICCAAYLLWSASTSAPKWAAENLIRFTLERFSPLRGFVLEVFARSIRK